MIDENKPNSNEEVEKIDTTDISEVEQKAAVPPVSGRSDKKVAHRTRASALFIAVTLAAVILILLLVFVLQNLNSVPIYFLGLKGHLPLGVALIFAVVGGVLLSSVIASLRILQLRLRARRLGH
ncbi:Uncharacterized integral membrane protein [Ferrithrix thermotolerans DSM 19514]|uniref:Uncharacterized integral membrane protein n=1 Tax=Ferrithrix thermotolerans DSM 19514 TaxID=1121881 RepID=A0A1M4UGD3_9ACTN|nr:lipopolysaccharide assembly protein LapA domain-containing protein [Ferrithrix thermotolerans]SHE55630.1 Uncharacterized integral membrane protein [Ferrithrix thermotolerans DSM 19514]